MYSPFMPSRAARYLRGSISAPPARGASAEGVRRHDRRNLREQAPTEPVTQFGQPPPLVVFKPQAVTRNSILQEAILFTKERDHIGLLTL